MEYVALPLGEKAPEVAIHVILSKVKDILATSSKASIAVLCKFKDSIRALQKAFVLGLSVKELPDNIKIETVDRVQGLTIDYCFSLYPMYLQGIPCKVNYLMWQLLVLVITPLLLLINCF